MKVLLTGGSGFVGSHILDELRALAIPAAVLLRATSSRTFLAPYLSSVEVRTGSVDDPASLRAALTDITHVIHCAGLVKALRVQEFYEVNEVGTRNLVEAVNEQRERVQRLVHISSLAAAGPALPDLPLRETDAPHPVSEYGRSKLAGEQAVTGLCKTGFVVLRPPAVYGPRDKDFYLLFKAVGRHLLPRFTGGKQALSLVYVKDLAAVAVACLTAPGADGHTFFVAAPEVVTTRGLAAEIARQMHRWTVPLRLPSALFWPLCLWEETVARLTNKPRVLSRQKYPELCAPAWTCDPARLQQELGLSCSTRLEKGLAETLEWYRREGWLK